MQGSRSSRGMPLFETPMSGVRVGLARHIRPVFSTETLCQSYSLWNVLRSRTRRADMLVGLRF